MANFDREQVAFDVTHHMFEFELEYGPSASITGEGLSDVLPMHSGPAILGTLKYLLTLGYVSEVLLTPGHVREVLPTFDDLTMKSLWALTPVGKRVWMSTRQKQMGTLDHTAAHGPMPSGGTTINNHGQITGSAMGSGPISLTFNQKNEAADFSPTEMLTLLQQLRASTRELPAGDDRDDLESDIDEAEKAAKTGRLPRFMQKVQGVLGAGTKILTVATGAVGFKESLDHLTEAIQKLNP